MRKVLALVAAILCGAAPASFAGRLSPGLERIVNGMKGSDEITVLVVLRDQAPIAVLDQSLHLAQAPRAERHRAVVDALREAAARSQGPILQELTARRAAGPVRDFTSYWIVNALRVATTVDGVRDLARRADVDVIEPNLQVELIEPVGRDPLKSGGGSAIAAIGITPGVVAVGARRVWTELGIDGTGALIGGMDTGVDGAHPSLSSRWRGNFAPASECWRDAVGFGDPTPVDHHYHGTHTMGTMCGLAPNDTIGVAPGALWIADNTINQGTGAAFDSDVISGFQWFADPDGNSSTLADVPDVVQNSWGVNEGFSGYFDCDTRWWAAIDNCEAAGVVVTWSAGNEGPGSTTLRSPADRAASPYNTFSVGATQHTAPFTIAGFSSRGPSGCGGIYAMKPEISAPGVDVYSAQPGGGYQNLDGTSMAGPHVAGVVALMRAANPDVDVETVKQILMDTAVDLGTPGEDTAYGHGFVNAYDAVLAVLAGYGRIEGTVNNAVSSAPIPGVAVDVLADPRATTTNASGFFALPLPAGSWTLEYSAFGYLTDTQAIQVVADQISDGSLAMTPAPATTVSGVVTDFTSAPVAGATITVLDTPLAPVTSLADGSYAISVPDGATYSIRARKNGFGADTHTVVVAGPTTQNFVLPQLNDEDFESGNFLLWPWAMSGTLPWTIDTSNKYEGTYSARSGAITHSQASTMTMTVYLVNSGDLTFWYNVSSEATFDFLRFSIDGTQVGSWSGAIPWTQATYAVSSGSHTFSWSYTKDGSVNTGSDAAWVDFIEMPLTAVADAGVDPAALTAAVPPGQTAQRTLTLSNTGGAPLQYAVTIEAAPGATRLPDVKAVPLQENALQLGKGEPDPRVGEPPLLGSGGPDSFGYRWIDSDQAGGPVYQWVEISGIGTPLSMSDESYTASLPLGFTFSFYGNNYTSTHVSANGFVSFTSPTSTQYYTNGTLPSAPDPDDMVCAYWDDLNPGDGGTIYTYQDVANQRYIVQWNNVPRYQTGGAQQQTFEIILNSNGSIVTQYKSVNNVTSSTVGIENVNGSIGLQVVFNAAYLHNSLAIRFSTEPPVPWLTVAPLGGSVAPQGTGNLTATFDATSLALGVYHAIIRLATNDLDESTIDVPVTLTVSNATDVVALTDVPSRFELGVPTPNPFGATTSIRYSIPTNQESVTLSVFDVAGRRVRTLLKAATPAGRYVATWDGRDSAGRRVVSGVYFYRMDAGSFSSVRKVTLLK